MTPDGESLDGQVDPDIVCRLIVSGQEEGLHPLWKALLPVLRGPFDADKMDFILRDGRSLGLEGISPHEVERLTLTSFLYPEHEGPPVFCVDSSSLEALIAFLRQRQYLTTVAYHHRTVRAFEEQLRPELESALSELLPRDPRECLDSLLACDEDSVHHLLKQAYDGPWSRLQRRRLDWKLAYETKRRHDKQPAPIDRLTVERVTSLLSGFPPDQLWVSVEPYEAPPAIRTAIYLLDRNTRKLRRFTAVDFWRHGIVIYGEFLKVYTRSADLVPQVAARVAAILGESALDRALEAGDLPTSW